MVGCHVVQRDMKSNLLTFMLPRRLARSMTRNFLMRSLRGEGGKETVSESAVVFLFNSGHVLMLSLSHKENLSGSP